MKLEIRAAFLLLLLCSLSLSVIAKEPGPEDGEWFVDLLLRQEQTTDLPNNREDIERTRLFFWADLNAPINSDFSLGASIYGNYGSDDAQDNRTNLDNSETDTVEVDQFFIQWHHSESGSAWIGKHYLPVALSAMVWDKDIFTVGISSVNEWTTESDAEVLIGFGVHRVEHIFSDQTNMAFAQFEYGQFLGDIFFTTSLSLVAFEETEFLVADGVVRTNSTEALQEGFELALLNLGIDFAIGDVGASFSIEALNNLAVDDNNTGTRFNLVIGDSSVKNGWQANVHYQDLERDAAIAAFNDDDWWFKTRMTGYRISGSFGLTDDTAIQLSYFDEELLAENTKRLFLEISSSF
ncbi:hypothetical protein FLL45_02485 [Aliikangiella marina]|uniref:Porin n=1 Tax=Aliikangiella marina TaxID=1712262 RepID=A0A545THY8_9GAMM|nr:putative porin [Aliikangiella marina]TQV76843.1 hypothetical protein FLL45_02485 [Aliikangiella marina]